MDIRNNASHEWSLSQGETFTGPVWLTRLAEPVEPGQITMLGVHFAPGSRTDWHSHPGGQILYVVSGSGYVMNAGGERQRIDPGDTVTAPPGELHWHGATKESPMTHLSITSHGETQWEGRKVTDQEYDG